jgi:hypothetical protein
MTSFYNRFLVLFGGVDETVVFNDVYIFDTGNVSTVQDKIIDLIGFLQ